MATPSSGCNSVHYSAHSNPNLTGVMRSSSSSGLIARSSSHPPEMFCWDEAVPSHPIQCITAVSDVETQTEVDILHQYVTQNPRKILEILGLNPDLITAHLYKSNMKKSKTVPNSLMRSESYQFRRSNDKGSSSLEKGESMMNIRECSFFWDPSNSRSGDDLKIFEAINVKTKYEKQNFQS